MRGQLRHAANERTFSRRPADDRPRHPPARLPPGSPVVHGDAMVAHRRDPRLVDGHGRRDGGQCRAPADPARPGRRRGRGAVDRRGLRAPPRLARPRRRRAGRSLRPASRLRGRRRALHARVRRVRPRPVRDVAHRRTRRARGRRRAARTGEPRAHRRGVPASVAGRGDRYVVGIRRDRGGGRPDPRRLRHRVRVVALALLLQRPARRRDGAPREPPRARDPRRAGHATHRRGWGAPGDRRTRGGRLGAPRGARHRRGSRRHEPWYRSSWAWRRSSRSSSSKRG